MSRWPKLTTEERFWAKVDRRGPDECWPWLGAKNKNEGYGVFCLKTTKPKRNLHAHRFAYQTIVGPVPEGLVLDHYRLNPGPRNAPCSRACVNPAHSEPATNKENILRGNGITASCARRTACPSGHKYSGRNIDGQRICRPCDAERHRVFRAARASRLDEDDDVS